MNKYRVLFMRRQVLDWHDVEAKDEDDAYKKAVKKVNKYDLDDTDYEEIELLEE